LSTEWVGWVSGFTLFFSQLTAILYWDMFSLVVADLASFLWCHVVVPRDSSVGAVLEKVVFPYARCKGTSYAT